VGLTDTGAARADRAEGEAVMVSVKVTDPHKMVASVHVVAEHDDVVLLLVDMAFAGKRAETLSTDANCVEYIADPNRVGGNTLAICRIEVDGLPFSDGHVIATDSGRYTAWLTFAKRAIVRTAYSAE
jgi:hypothetical protein